MANAKNTITVQTLETIGSSFVSLSLPTKDTTKLVSANVVDKKAVVHFDRIVTIKGGTRIATSSSSFTHSNLVNVSDKSIVMGNIAVDKISGFVYLKDAAMSTLEESIGKVSITMHNSLVVKVTGNSDVKKALNTLYGKPLTFIKNK